MNKELAVRDHSDVLLGRIMRALGGLRLAGAAAVGLCAGGWAPAAFAGASATGTTGTVLAESVAAEEAEAVAGPRQQTVVFAWNYTPDPAVTPVKRAVAAGLDFRDLADGWKAKWEKRRVTFWVDGQQATPRQVAQRLREVPVLTWAHPYHYGWVTGAPQAFSPEGIKGTAEMVAMGKETLRKVLTEEQVNRVYHVLDFENCGPYQPSKFAPHKDGEWTIKKDSSWPVNVPHLATCCYLFGEALRACNWIGWGAANYNTNHTPHRREFGVEPYFRASPYHVPGSLDGKTTCVSGYWTGGPDGCLTETEMLDVIAKSRGPLWLVLDDYQPRRDDIIRAAIASGKVRLIGLWGQGHDPDNPTWSNGHKNRDKNPQWGRAQDAAIAEALRLSGQ